MLSSSGFSSIEGKIGLSVPLFIILLGFDLILLLIGTFVDIASAIILLTPVFLPALKSLGVFPIQFGAIMITGMAIGLVTPPVGMCLYVASTISKQVRPITSLSIGAAVSQ